jgi:large subunit ribosomal protein L25
MTESTVIKTENRSDTGSRAARRLRAAGLVPVNVYGHGEANQHLAIDEHQLDLALHTQHQVFTLAIGEQEQPCLVKHVQYDAFGQRIVHVDFTRVSLTEEVEVEVELDILGPAKGVTDGGQMVVHHPAVWVRCRANAIPDSLPVDITALLMGQALHAGDVSLPPGVALDEEKMAPQEALVTVVAPRAAAAEEEEEAVMAEGEEAAPAAGEPEAEGESPPAADAPKD